METAEDPTCAWTKTGVGSCKALSAGVALNAMQPRDILSLQGLQSFEDGLTIK